MKRLTVLSVAACLALAGCISNAIRVWGPANKVPYPLYAGPLHPPEQDASLLLLTEVDERGNTTKGWVRILTVDGIDVSKVPNTWAHIEPGQHDVKFVCRAGPLHAAFKERVKQATYVLEPNTTYFWKINLIYSVDGRPMNCEGDGMNEPGMDKGHIALIPGL